MTTRFRLLSSLAALCTTLLLMLSPAVALAVPSWSVVTQVTAPGATTTQAPQFLSGTDGSITAITAETVSSISTILARHSTDGGTTWGSPVTLSAPGIASSDVAAIRLNNGHFAVAWAEASGASNVNHIRLITSSNNGLTWSTPQTISTAGSNPYAANKPHLAALGSADIAVGFQQSDGSNDIAMVRNSASQLQSWTQAVSLSVAGSNAKFVTPVVNSAGDIVVSWVLVASDSTKQTQIAGSSNWSAVTTLTSHAVTGNTNIPVCVALPTGDFVVLWANPTSSNNPNFEVTARTSTDAGVTWGSAVALSIQSFPNYISAVVTPDGGISAAWSIGTGGYSYIQTTTSSPTSSPSPSSSSSSSPSSSSSSSSSSSPSSSSSSSSSAGSVWQSPQSITSLNTGEFYSNPKLVVGDDGTVAMVFSQNVNSTSASGFALSSDNGQSWPQGIGTLSMWLSTPLLVSDLSLGALTGQGFIFGWQTLNNSAPDKGFARVYGWISGGSSGQNSQDSLAATGTMVWIGSVIGIGMITSGLVFWAVQARALRRR